MKASYTSFERFSLLFPVDSSRGVLNVDLRRKRFCISFPSQLKIYFLCMAFSAFLFILKLNLLFVCSVKSSAAFEIIIRSEPFALLIRGYCAFANSVLHFILLSELNLLHCTALVFVLHLCRFFMASSFLHFLSPFRFNDCQILVLYALLTHSILQSTSHSEYTCLS